MHACICECEHTGILHHAFSSAKIYVCLCVCVFVCLCVCVMHYMCFVCMYVYMHACIHECEHTDIPYYAFPSAQIYVCSCVLVFVRVYVYL